MKRLLELFYTFAKIGLFTFGGGYAMLSIIRRSCVEEKKWITDEEMMNLVVVAESTPGPISINCSTYVGYRQGGILGALAATLGVVLPSFAIIFVISRFLEGFLEIRIIARAFRGIKLAVGILIVDAGVGMLRKMKLRPLGVVILVCAGALLLLIDLLSWHFSTIYMLLIAAGVGLLAARFFPEKRGGGEK